MRTLLPGPRLCYPLLLTSLLSVGCGSKSDSPGAPPPVAVAETSPDAHGEAADSVANPPGSNGLRNCVQEKGLAGKDYVFRVRAEDVKPGHFSLGPVGSGRAAGGEAVSRFSVFCSPQGAWFEGYSRSFTYRTQSKENASGYFRADHVTPKVCAASARLMEGLLRKKIAAASFQLKVQPRYVQVPGSVKPQRSGYEISVAAACEGGEG